MADTLPTEFSQTRGQKSWASRAGGLQETIEQHRDVINAHAADIEGLVAGGLTNELAFSVNTQSSAVDANISTFANLHLLTMSAASRFWTLPDATGTYEGNVVTIWNAGGTYSFGIKDSSGATLVATLPVTRHVTLQCEDNGTSAGTWKVLKPALNFLTGVAITTPGLYDILMDAGSGAYVDVAPASARTFLGLAIGTDVQAYDADTLKADAADTLTAGFDVTSHNAGTKSSGTFTPAPASGNMQYAVNGGAHTLAPPSTDCTMVIQYTNNGSAGAITTSGFTRVDGSFSTVNGEDFLCYITRVNGFSHLNIVKVS